MDNHKSDCSSASSISSKDASPFLKLPPELRLEIYRHLLYRPYPINFLQMKHRLMYPRVHASSAPLSKIGHHRSLEILRVSKEVSIEALGVLYGEHIFSIELNGYNPRHSCLIRVEGMTRRNKKRVRKLEFILVCPNLVIDREIELEAQFWEFVLEKESLELYLVARHADVMNSSFDCRMDSVGPYRQRIPPGAYEEYFWRGQQERKAEQWMRPVLQCIQQNLSAGVTVGVDGDGYEATTKLLKEYFPNCRRGSTFTGDKIFCRGGYLHPGGALGIPSLPRLYHENSLREKWRQYIFTR